MANNTTKPKPGASATDQGATELAPKPNLIFTGHKLGRAPLEFFNNGKRVNIAPIGEQVGEREVETKNEKGETEKTTELVGVPFYHDDPALVVRSTRVGMYKFYEGESDGEKKTQ